MQRPHATQNSAASTTPSSSGLLQRLFLGFVVALFGGFAASCSGAGSAAERITLRDYKSSQQGTQEFELCDKGNGDKLDYYSTLRSSAPRKFIESDVMKALTEYLGKNGFNSYAQEGSAPLRMDANGRLRYAFEWEVDGEVNHWPIGDSNFAPSLESERREFRNAQQMFLELFNSTTSYQAVQNQGGKDIFESDRDRLKGERKANKQKRS